MSKSAQITLWVVVAILIVAGLAWWIAGNQSGPSYPAAQAPAPSSNQAGGNALVANGTSNAALQSDLANVDSQINSFNSDSQSIDQGMNDQPVQQQQL